MTDEELRDKLIGTSGFSIRQRVEWLEADASAQRTVILKLERQIKMLAGAIVLAGIVAVIFKIAKEMLT